MPLGEANLQIVAWNVDYLKVKFAHFKFSNFETDPSFEYLRVGFVTGGTDYVNISSFKKIMKIDELQCLGMF